MAPSKAGIGNSKTSVFIDKDEERKLAVNYNFLAKGATMTKESIGQSISDFLLSKEYKAGKKENIFSYAPRKLWDILNGEKLKNTVEYEVQEIQNSFFLVECEVRVLIGSKILLPSEQANWEAFAEDLRSSVDRGHLKSIQKPDKKMDNRARNFISVLQGAALIVAVCFLLFSGYSEGILSDFFLQKKWVPGFMFQSMTYFDSLILKFFFTSALLFLLSTLFDINAKRREEAENEYLETRKFMPLANTMTFFLQDVLKKALLVLAAILFAIPTFMTIDEMMKAMLGI